MKASSVIAGLALSAAAWTLVALPDPVAHAEQRTLVVVPTAEARNIQVEPGLDGRLTILYDLAASDPKASVTVTLQATVSPSDAFDVTPLATEGDIGDNVLPGSRKRIVWDAGKDVEEVQTERFRFRVVTSAFRPDDLAPAGAPGHGAVTVISSPDGAQIALDGRPVGLAPLEIHNVPEGRHRLTATKAGFAEATGQLLVIAGESARIELPLTPATVSAPVAAPRKGSGLKWIAIGGGGAAAAIAAVASGSGAAAGTTTPPATTTTTPPTTTTTTSMTPPNRAPTVTCSNINIIGLQRAYVATDVAVVSATRLQFVIATASDPDGDSLSFTITYSANTTATGTYSATNNSTTYVYPAAGVFLPTATVRDARGGEGGCSFPRVTTSTIAGEWTGPPTVGRLSSRFSLAQSGLNVTGNYFEAERTAASALQGTLTNNVAGRKDGTMSLTVGGNYGGQLTFLLEPADDLRTYRGTYTYRGVTTSYEMRK